MPEHVIPPAVLREVLESWYLLICPNDTEPCLVYYYYNPDAEAWGYSFGLHNGAGFLPTNDLVSGTRIYACTIQVPSTYTSIA